MKSSVVAIVGTVGIPGRYGGFETLAEQLVTGHDRDETGFDWAVYCSGRVGDVKSFNGAVLRFISVPATGLTSIFYDALSMAWSVFARDQAILVLGVSGAIFFPLLRCFSKIKIVVNIDGIESTRQKWGWFARKFLLLSEWFAVKFSHVVVADNEAVARYVVAKYLRQPEVIAYGGDHASVQASPGPVFASLPHKVPDQFFLSVSRIEPENNVHLILQAFDETDQCIVYVGNWFASDYGRKLYKKYCEVESTVLLEPIYDLGALAFLRSKCCGYIHGHSAGGTNPSLVEMMFFSKPIIAFDCEFNRVTTGGLASFFRASEDLRKSINLSKTIDVQAGYDWASFAEKRYTWSIVGSMYRRIFTQILAKS